MANIFINLNFGVDSTLYACVCGVCIQQSELWVYNAITLCLCIACSIRATPIIQLAECHTHHTHTRRV